MLRRLIAAGTLLLCIGTVPARAQFNIEAEPINYSSDILADPVSGLVERVRAGEASLQYEPEHGWLKSLLETLHVPVSSQSLVFSKTSLQRSRISPRTPRAIYFNDDIYIGWMPNGEVIEISSVDPQKGAIFYTLDQHDTKRPRFRRETDRCLICHSSTHTRGVPGQIVRSVYADADGQPVFRAGTYRTDPTSPFEKRWGGWYVTGTHGAMRHMGNVIVQDENDPERLDVESGANTLNLTDRFNTARYLSPHSDIVALMVLEHQSDVHNAITTANYSARLALRDKQVMNDALGRDPDYESQSTRRRISGAVDDLVEALLMCGEFRLTSPVTGTSAFAEEFVRTGPRDAQGRSLRDFDLQTRLFRYPCHYLIYSESFRALPERIRTLTLERIYQVLDGRDRSPQFAHLTKEDRRDVLEILTQTLPDLPKSWPSEESASAGARR